MRFVSWSNDTLCWSTLIISAETQGRTEKVQGKYGPKSGMSDLFRVFKSGARWSQKPSVAGVCRVCWFRHGFTMKKRNERSREKVRLVMGCVRELLNNRKTLDILKVFRIISKVKTRDIPMPQILHSCTCTSRAVSARLPISNAANRKNFPAKLAVPSPKANDRHPSGWADWRCSASQLSINICQLGVTTLQLGPQKKSC